MTTTMPKVLMVSDGHGGEIYDQALSRGFRDEGCEVVSFSWKGYFHHYQYADRYPTDGNRLKSFYYRLQNKLIFGPAVWKIQRDLLKYARRERPDLVFIYRGTHVWPSTLKRLTVMGAHVVGYNNDDPFSDRYPFYFWRHFKRGLKHYTHVFAYRHKNIPELKAAGAPAVSLLRSYYLHTATRPIAKPELACDVIFIGHFEADGRDDLMMHLLNQGINLKLYGTSWKKSRHYEAFCQHMGGPIVPLYGEDYGAGLASAKVALVFLSKLNNDTYTRRCFEIPAVGTLMACEKTDDIASLFEPGKEVVLFENADDLAAQLKSLLATPDRLAAMAKAGHARLLADGHEVQDRAHQVLTTLGFKAS
ncbi:MAG: hypothetical protein COY40_00005 [Alphaproteobacteria bacterium CG_4_10_14_0_8_um_filter_53_9]|nr:MAG: hypothetical protein COY40_00005 [Alphaproteobacteria bacterium CG_4_10_14_0_8_um_filter_53_9]